MYFSILLLFMLTVIGKYDSISLATSVGRTSTKRFSNLYGTVLSCSDYLLPDILDGNRNHRNPQLRKPLSDLTSVLSSHKATNYRDRESDAATSTTKVNFGAEHQPLFNVSITWQVRSNVNSNKYHHSYTSVSSLGKASLASGANKPTTTADHQQFRKVNNHANLRYINPTEGTLSFSPFDSIDFLPDIHDAYYQCLVRLPQGVLISREVHLQAVVEIVRHQSSAQGSSSSTYPFHKQPSTGDDIYVRTMNSSETIEGNDAILGCDFDRHSSLWQISAWFRDDGRIFLPLDSLLQSVRQALSGTTVSLRDALVNYTSIRHLILPESGDLLVSDVRFRDMKHRYRCQVQHVLTNVRVYASTWGHIRIKENSELYHSGPRLNPELQTRHTVAVNEGESAFFYCSFDGYPSPVIQWYHTDIKTLSRSSGSPSSVPASPSSSIYYNTDLLFEAYNSKTLSTPTITNTAYLSGKNFLAIEKVSMESTGIVTCVANNSNSLVKHEMLLFVKNSIHVSLHATSASPYPGQDITLSCNLSTNFASRYVAANTAFASFGSAAGAATSGEPQDDVEEQTRRLRELISTHFLLNIVWFHNGKPIDFDHRKRRSSEEQLLIRDFHGPDDNGIYQCTIRLTGPDYEDENFMSAIGISALEKAPQWSSVFNEQIKLIDKGEPLSLHCEANGIPLPRIRWLLDGVEQYSSGHVRIDSVAIPAPHHSGSSGGKHYRSVVSHLNISSLLIQDIGVYECVAENYAGSVRHRARINQMGSPFVKPIANQTAVFGNPFTINCTYGGYPLEEVYFVKGTNGGGQSNKDEKRMPFDERHLVPMLGSITLNPVEQSDQDHYRCVVITSNGQRAEQQFYLRVVVAPVISPIVFSDNLEEGMRGSAVCTVTSGDRPIQIRWLKDGMPLREQMPTINGKAENYLNHIQIVSIKDFMSSLIITNITRHHQGVYTCVASSPVAMTNVSAYLSVRATPRWLLKPVDQHSIVGHSLTLDCQASGQPLPVTRWKYIKNEPYHNEPMPILSSQQIHVLENGSLYFRSLELKHSGVYICDASNGVNKSPIEARATLTVTNLPKVSIQNTLTSGSGTIPKGSGNSVASLFHNHAPIEQRLLLRKGAQTQLMCSAIGSESPMSIEWLRPNEKSAEDLSANQVEDHHQTAPFRFDEPRVVLREESKLNEKRTYLYVSHLKRIDSGIYGCLATNVNGYSVAFIDLRVQEPPDSPVAFRALEVNSRTVTLTWSAGYSGNLPTTSFVVEYKDYLNRSSKNEPDNDISPGGSGNQNTVLTAKSPTTSITITGLNPLSTYEFRVSAYNELGNSPFTDPLILTTEIEAPSSIPREIRTLVLNSRSIKLIWSIVLTYPIEQIDGFYIGYRPIAATTPPGPQPPAPSASDSAEAKADSAKITSMPSYTFKTMYDLAKLEDSIDDLQPNGDVTSAHNSTTLCEVLPETSGVIHPVSRISARKLRKGHRSSKLFGMDQVRCTYEFTVPLLSRKTRYGFIVQAFNTKGAGPTSTEVYAQTLLKDPPGKTELKLYNVTSYEASFMWQASFDSHDSLDSSLDGYIISFRSLAKQPSLFQGTHKEPEDTGDESLEQKDRKYYQLNEWETISLSEKYNSYTLRNLKCGTLYRIKVEAFNEMGNGEASDVLEFVTVGQVPVAPNTNAFIVPNITSVALDLDRWGNGLCPIHHFALRYRIKDMTNRKPQPPESWITVSTHIKPEYESKFLIRDLLPATWYELSVVAVNDAGESESRFLFATLTMFGATVEPLYLDGYNRRHLGAIGLMSSENLLEDPMILIPATCALLVLLVVGAATAFIFITRNKENLNNSDHFCQHRDNSRSDQLSLNSFSKNYSKSELIRTYADPSDPHKLTQIETLNCGQSDMMLDSSGSSLVPSQYVEGPNSLGYIESKISDEQTEPGTPSRRGKPNGKVHQKRESFYSTPIVLNERSGIDSMTPYITQTMRKCQLVHNENRCDPEAVVRSQDSTFQSGHPYYTHSQFNMAQQPVLTAEKQNNDHIYELPKQQQQQQQQHQQQTQQFEQNDPSLMMLLMQQQQQITNQQKSSPRNIRPDFVVSSLRGFQENF